MAGLHERCGAARHEFRAGASRRAAWRFASAASLTLWVVAAFAHEPSAFAQEPNGQSGSAEGRRIFGAAAYETDLAPPRTTTSGDAPRATAKAADEPAATPTRAAKSRAVAYAYGPSTMSEQDYSDQYLVPAESNRTYSYHYPWYYGTVAGAYSPAHYAAYRTHYYLYGLPYNRWGWGGWGWGGRGWGGWGYNGGYYGGYYGRYGNFGGYVGAGPYGGAPYGYSFFPQVYAPRAYAPQILGPAIFGGSVSPGIGLGWGPGYWGSGLWPGPYGAPSYGATPGYATPQGYPTANCPDGASLGIDSPFPAGEYYGPIGYRGFFW